MNRVDRNKDHIYGIDVNFISFSYQESNPYLEGISEDFNEYSKANGLDINLNRVLLSPANTTVYLGDYAATIKSLLKKNKDRYDLFMMSALYTNTFESYTSDLRLYVSSETLKNYSKGVGSTIGVINDKIIGLPLYLDMGVLYSNKMFLGKYNKTIPKTWDELLETGQYILEREKKQGNEDVIGYLGYFPSTEAALCSLHEIIFSYRDEVNSTIPEYSSKNALEALLTIKKIKNTISSDGNFMLRDEIAVQFLLSNKVIFGRFWNGPLGMYHITRLPGGKEGLSSTYVNGYYLIMNKNISEERKIATGKVIDFLLSKEVQLKYVNSDMKLSGMVDLYDDPACNPLYANLYKSMQFIYNEPELVGNPDENTEKLALAMDYMYGNETAKNTLRYMSYLDEIFFIEINSKYGISTLSVIGVLFGVMAISYFLMFLHQFNFFLRLFDKKCWFIALSGLCIYGSYGLFLLGELTPLKCQLKFSALVLGVSFFYYPFLTKLIIYFPFPNKFSKCLRYHNVLCIICAMVIDFAFVLAILLNSPYKIEKVEVENGMNFNTCAIESKYHYIYYTIYILIKVMECTSLVLLIFVEWNMRAIQTEIRIIFTCLYINFLFILLLFIENIVQIKNLYYHFSLKIVITLMMVFVNYVTIVCVYIYHYIDEKRIRSAKIIVHSENSDIKELNRRRSERKSISNILLGFHYAPDMVDQGSFNSETIPGEAGIMLYTDVISPDQVTDISSCTGKQSDNDDIN